MLHYILTIIFSCFALNLYADDTNNVWDVLRTNFTLNHEVKRSEVQQQINWFLSHPGFIQRVAKRSEPYIYHIVTAIQNRSLPGELALIPMIESAYNPFAYSKVGAAGLWQLMPETSNDLGLKSDWWFDARRSIGYSTNAALNYLTTLNKSFHGDWLLTFAAYDAGEGSINRSIKNNKSFSFWNITVPQETKAYVPRLLALAEIISHYEVYHIKLPTIRHIPYFKEVNIGSQIDLKHAAKLAGISYQDLIKLNPEYNHWATAPYQPYKLLIPISKVWSFYQNLSQLPISQRVTWIKHIVQPNEDITIIANAYHTTEDLIKNLNGLKDFVINAGQMLLIPKANNIIAQDTSTPVFENPSKISKFFTINPYKIIHIIQSTDTLESISKKYNVSIADLKLWNHLNDENVNLKDTKSLLILPTKNSVQSTA